VFTAPASLFHKYTIIRRYKRKYNMYCVIMGEPNFEFSERDKKMFEFFFNNCTQQGGIFCIEDIRRALGIHRTEAVREIKSQKEMGILKEISSEEARKILGTKNKLGRHHYYKINLESPFALWWFDNKRAIAIEVLVKEIGEEARPIIKKLKKKIKTESILKELKILQLL